jgi:uncharacterized membrane protein YqgA involved in biofilm formation
MSAKSQFSIWGPFIAATLLSWVVAETACSIRLYYFLIGSLGVVNIVLAVRVLRRTGAKFWAILRVIVGLVIGQLRTIEGAVTILFWTFRGFAP